MHSTCPTCDDQISSLIPFVTAGSKCGQCAHYRHSLDKPAFLYLISHPELNKHKIGIGIVNDKKSKIVELINQGYEVYGIWHTEDKRETYNWEQKVFKELKAKLQPQDENTPDPMGVWVRNWSESIAASAITLAEIEKIITKIVKT